MKVSVQSFREARGTADPGGARPLAPAKCWFQHDFTKQP